MTNEKSNSVSEVMVEMSQLRLSQLKSQITNLFAVSLIFIPIQLLADEVVPLYIEDGNIQVSKVVRRNSLGGEVVEYVKTKIDNEQSQSPELQKLDQFNVTKVEEPQKNSFNTGATEKAQQNAALDLAPEIEIVPPVVNAPKKGLVITTEGKGNEEALLKKIKALKPAGENLKLAPGEELVNGKGNIEIKPTLVNSKTKSNEDAMISRLEFNQANILDVARALADISNLNFVATEQASKKNVTVFLQNISVKDALEAVTKNTGLWYRKDKDSGTFRIMTTEEYQRDLVVYREDITRVFDLLHPNPVNVATAVRDLYGERVILSYGADYDDFFTGEFNSGGGIGGGAGGGAGRGAGVNRGAQGGAGLGRGQAGLRRGITSGISSRNGGGIGGGGFGQNNNQNRAAVEKEAGTAGNMAITENLSATQLERLEEMLQIDENGDLVVRDGIRGISRAQQPIYITISKQQNLMIVRTSDAIAVKEIENLVKAMDKPTQQVLLEMRILEVDVGDAYTQLFSFGALSSNGKSLATSREDGNRSGTGKFVYQFIDNLIGIKLELLQQNNQARVVSSPVLLASNNRTARLFVGEERLLIRGATLTDAVIGLNANIITPARITYETELRNVGNSLNITPKINADGTVTLGIFQDTSTVNVGAIAFPPLVANGQVVNINIDSVNTANIEGVVVAKDGLTVAIGGLIRNTVTKEENKVPILGDIPIIGNAFKDKFESARRTEMVLLITPHIMTEPSVTDDVSRDAVEPLTTQQW